MNALANPPLPKPLPEVPPEWRLRPDFTRPLSSINPLDYLKLLYWVFFKPQFIREYVKWIDPKAAPARGGRDVWNALRGSPQLRRFVLQSLLLEIIAPVLVCYVLQMLGLPVSWSSVA
jgi:hypothetical protein